MGNFFEWAENINTHVGVKKSYYYAGSTCVAMRTGSGDPQFLLGDHLGSTSKILNYNGTDGAPDRGYKPWGEVSLGPDDYLTGYQFTGQFRYENIGLYYYGARWYDESLGRFTQADTVIPGKYNPQSWDRYAFVINNPLKFIDPSGHYFSKPLIDGLYDVEYATKHAEEIGECPAGQCPNKSLSDPAWRGWMRTLYLNQKYNQWALSFLQTKEFQLVASGYATYLDFLAFVLNAIYAIIGGSIIILSQGTLAPFVWNFYQIFSYFPNLISVFSLAIWSLIDSINGKNKVNIEISPLGLKISGAMGLDTAISGSTNILGFTILRDPVSASLVDFSVLIYDLGRLVGLPEVTIPFEIYSPSALGVPLFSFGVSY